MADAVETIQARLLSNIDGTYDKSAGSYIYDIEYPVAIESNRLDVKADGILNNKFADTATSTYLEKIVGEQGLTRKSGGYSSGIVTITGTVGAPITTGKYVASDNVTFQFTSDSIIPSSGTIDVEVKCATIGTTGNVASGAIKYFPVTLEGLKTVTNVLDFDNGYSEETDDELKARYYLKVQNPSASGNKTDYINWALSIIGVLSARCIPIWSGPGTVKVIIIDSIGTGADQTLTDEVATYIETVRPVGATVTVVSATEVAINISVTLTIDTINYTQEEVLAAIQTNVTDYLKSIAFKQNYVSYAQLGSIILSTKGITDYSSLLVNTGTANIAIADTEVAVLGGVILG